MLNFQQCDDAFVSVIFMIIYLLNVSICSVDVFFHLGLLVKFIIGLIQC